MWSPPLRLLSPPPRNATVNLILRFTLFIHQMILGGKGANLCEMAKLTLPVPPAFIITTETCLEYFTESTGNLPSALDYEYALKTLEEDTGKTFGDPSNPLLVSVRSGAPASMPGTTCVEEPSYENTVVLLIRAVPQCFIKRRVNAPCLCDRPPISDTCAASIPPPRAWVHPPCPRTETYLSPVFLLCDDQ